MWRRCLGRPIRLAHVPFLCVTISTQHPEYCAVHGLWTGATEPRPAQPVAARVRVIPRTEKQRERRYNMRPRRKPDHTGCDAASNESAPYEGGHSENAECSRIQQYCRALLYPHQVYSREMGYHASSVTGANAPHYARCAGAAIM